MNKNAKMKKSIIGVGYAPVIFGEEDNSITYGAIKHLLSEIAGGRAYSADPVGSSQKLSADGKVVHADVVNDGYDIILTLLSAFDEGVNTDWLNKKKYENGIAEYADGEEYPYFALIIYEDTTDGVGKTTIFYYCQASGRPSINGKTSDPEGGNFDFEFPEYPISSMPRPTDMLVSFEIDSKEKLTSIPEPEESKKQLSADTEGNPVKSAAASTAAKSTSK